jgi:cytochrome P450
LGNLRELARDPLGLFLRSTVEYGGVARIRVAHLFVHLVSEPVFIKHVLVDNMRNYVKGVSYDALRHVLGDGLLVAEGELWRRQRRLLNPAFARQTLIDKVPLMVDVVAALCERWEAHAEDGTSLDLVSEMMCVAFEIVGRTLMGSDIADEMATVEAILPEAGDWVYQRMQAPIKLPLSLPLPSNRRYRRVLRVLDDVVRRVIDNHRRGDEGNDLLSLLIAARHEDDGAVMNDRQLRDEVITFLLAGHETTGSALAWTFTLLAEHPEVERKLFAEVDEVLGDRPLTADMFSRLTYTGQVIDEAMRLYPPAWSFTRTALADDTIGPYHVPRGSIVVISPWVNQRHPAYWHDPNRFDPQRFSSEKRYETYHYFPFGGGPHMCIGKYLTLYEVKVALAMVAARFRVVRETSGPVPMQAQITLHPRDPIAIRIERRSRRDRREAS